MGEHDDLVITPHVELDLGCGHMSGCSDAVAWLELSQAAPAVIGQQRVVGRQLHDSPTGRGELEDFLAPGGEDMGHDLRDVAERVVQ